MCTMTTWIWLFCWQKYCVKLGISKVILLMEEISDNHLRCIIKPYKWRYKWDKLPTSTWWLYRISEPSTVWMQRPVEIHAVPPRLRWHERRLPTGSRNYERTGSSQYLHRLWKLWSWSSCLFGHGVLCRWGSLWTSLIGWRSQGLKCTKKVHFACPRKEIKRSFFFLYLYRTRWW